MNVQLSLQNPGHLSNNHIFNFPHGLEHFDYTVVATVISETINGLGHDDSEPMDILGLTPVVDETNVIWSNKDADEQADVDGIMTIQITDVIVEENEEADVGEDGEDDGMQYEGDGSDEPDEHANATFMEADEGFVDPDDFDEGDEAIARAEAEERDEQVRRANELRLNVENDLKSELVGAKLNLEFTGGVLVRWELV